MLFHQFGSELAFFWLFFFFATYVVLNYTFEENITTAALDKRLRFCVRVLLRAFNFVYSREKDTFSPSDLASLNFWYNLFLKFLFILAPFSVFLKEFLVLSRSAINNFFLFWIHRLTSDLSILLLNASLIEGIPDSTCSMKFILKNKIVLFSFLADASRMGP